MGPAAGFGPKPPVSDQTSVGNPALCLRAWAIARSLMARLPPLSAGAAVSRRAWDPWSGRHAIDFLDLLGELLEPDDELESQVGECDGDCLEESAGTVQGFGRRQPRGFPAAGPRWIRRCASDRGPCVDQHVLESASNRVSALVHTYSSPAVLRLKAVKESLQPTPAAGQTVAIKRSKDSADPTCRTNRGLPSR